MLNLVKLILLLIIFLTPLITPFSKFGYEQAKVVVFTYLVDISALIYTFYLLKNRAKIKLKFSYLNLFALLFILVLFLTTISGVDPQTSFFGAPPYYQGFILFGHLFIFYLLISLSKIKLKQLKFSFVAGALLVSLIAIYQYFQIHILHLFVLTYNNRVVSSFGQPNLYSGFILMVLPLFLGLNPLKKRHLKSSWILILVILITGLLISFSRSAIGLGLLASYIYGIFYFKNWRKSLLILLLFTLLLGGYLSIKYSSGIIYSEISAPLKVDKFTIYDPREKRIYIWPIILKIIWAKPVLGYGLETIPESFPKFKTQRFSDLSVDRSHNYFLDLLVYSGIIGLLVYLIFIYQLIKRNKQNLILVSILIYLTWIQFQNQSIVELIFFWTLAAVISSPGKKTALN